MTALEVEEVSPPKALNDAIHDGVEILARLMTRLQDYCSQQLSHLRVWFAVVFVRHAKNFSLRPLSTRSQDPNNILVGHFGSVAA